eukprot:4961538-Prymnesium_polylepis.2
MESAVECGWAGRGARQKPARTDQSRLRSTLGRAYNRLASRLEACFPWPQTKRWRMSAQSSQTSRPTCDRRTTLTALPGA